MEMAEDWGEERRAQPRSSVERIEPSRGCTKESVAAEAAFRELQELEREKEEQRCPSLRHVDLREEADAAPLDESTSLRPRVLREARSRLLQRKTSKELLDEEDGSRKDFSGEEESCFSPLSCLLEDLHTILGLLKEIDGNVGLGSGFSKPNEQGQTMGRCQRPNLRPVPTSWYHDCEEQGSVTRAPDHSEVEVIDYNGFYKVRQELLKRGERFKQYFEPSHFLKFPRDPAGRIAIVPFFTFVVRRVPFVSDDRCRSPEPVNLSQTRVQLSYYDALGCGYLREKDPPRIVADIECWCDSLLAIFEPRLVWLPEHGQTDYGQFQKRGDSEHALILSRVPGIDPKRTGRVRIRDLLSSPILPELYELRQEHPLGDAEHNWFSMQSALKAQANGMLSRNELARFGSGMLTDVFIDRVFEEYQTYRDAETGEREMDRHGTIPLLRHRIQDYKTFLDFVLAMENKGTPQAVRYFWKLLDIHHTGCIDGFVINYFFRAIVKVLRQIKGSEIASVDDVKDEIFDMVRTGIITLDDLLHCSQGGTVLSGLPSGLPVQLPSAKWRERVRVGVYAWIFEWSMLFDAAAFWLYDNRESLLMEQDGFLVKVPTSMSDEVVGRHGPDPPFDPVMSRAALSLERNRVPPGAPSVSKMMNSIILILIASERCLGGCGFRFDVTRLQAISLPSLFPNAQGGNVWGGLEKRAWRTVGYPSETLRRNETEQRFDDSTAVRRQKSIKRTPSQLLLEKQQAGVGIWWPELIQFWDLEFSLVQSMLAKPKWGALGRLEPVAVAWSLITGFQDLARFSNHTTCGDPKTSESSVVPVDQPLFRQTVPAYPVAGTQPVPPPASVHPPVVAFVEFEGLQTYETMVTLRNQDNVARRVKVCPPDSPFFEWESSVLMGLALCHLRLLPARRVAKGGTVASSDVSRDKALAFGAWMSCTIAPGMEVSYVVRFKPDARIDYSYDLKVVQSSDLGIASRSLLVECGEVTEREEFSVPIRASGGSALLDFPDVGRPDVRDVIDFGDECIVGYQVNCANCERTVLVRNVGDRASKLLCRTTEPFSIDVPDGFLEEGASCQVSVFFTPSRAERYECDLQIKYGELEAVATLRGQARNAEVSLSHSLLLIEDTYVGLESQGVVTIRNDSDVPIDFSWRLFSSTVEEAQHRLALHRQLKTEEMDELLYMQQANLSEDEESESGSDGERRRVRRERKVTKLLGRKYDSIMKAVEEDPMLFRDAIFKIEPLCGRLWPQTQVTCACCFLPKDALVYCATAFLSAVGQEDRAPLVLKGLGIGPKATFSYDELDVGNVFVESAHRYEVQLLNQGDIEFDFRLVHREGKFAPRFKFTPDHGTIAVGGQCEIVVDFKPKELGPFHEAVTLAFRGTSVRPKFRGPERAQHAGHRGVGRKVPGPTVTFDPDRSNLRQRQNPSPDTLYTSTFRGLMEIGELRVPCYYTLTVKGDEAPPNNEFEIIPSRGTLLPNCAQRIQVDFISQTEKKYDMRLSVDLEGVGKELLSIPMFAQCAVPTVSFEPHGCLNYGDVFIRYPFHQSLYLHNTSATRSRCGD
ncbi:unnamed protein product [Durusdinium trenchii]|uniref:HYDIN/VesB/CFA65-like Ig-like domain-containing protein n=1 Tax=Durusdinium trenchii TaxID=1381693 RepID=A0ABP0RFK1_9DINO